MTTHALDTKIARTWNSHRAAYSEASFDTILAQVARECRVSRAVVLDALSRVWS